MEQKKNYQPSAAFIGASWTALLIGVTAFLIGLWNADMQLNEKGYYFTVLMFGLFFFNFIVAHMMWEADTSSFSRKFYIIMLFWFFVLEPLKVK